jgi:hypothetical protein
MTKSLGFWVVMTMFFVAHAVWLVAIFQDLSK